MQYFSTFRHFSTPCSDAILLRSLLLFLISYIAYVYATYSIEEQSEEIKWSYYGQAAKLSNSSRLRDEACLDQSVLNFCTFQSYVNTCTHMRSLCVNACTYSKAEDHSNDFKKKLSQCPDHRTSEDYLFGPIQMLRRQAWFFLGMYFLLQEPAAFLSPSEHL